MADLTLEQQQARARAQARLRLQQSTAASSGSAAPSTPAQPSVEQPAQPQQSGIARGLGLITRAVAPYAAAGGAGAIAGLPAGGVGAIPGAIGGMTAYGVSQLVDLLATGGKGQEAVERGLTAVGLPEPQSAAENIGISGIRGVLGAGSTASQLLKSADSMRLARLLQGQTRPASVTEDVLRVAGANPQTQAVAGGLGAATAQGAREAGAPEPVAMLAGIAGGSTPYVSVGGAQQTAQAAATTGRNIVQSVRQAGQRGQPAPPAPNPPSVSPMPPNRVRESNVSLLEREGVPISPGQRSGAPFTQTVESVMKYLPTSTGQAARFTDLQHRAYNRALLARAGIESDIATPEVLRAGQQRFAQTYDDLERNTVLMGGSRPLAQRLAQIESNYNRGFSGQMRRSFVTMRDDLLAWANGNPRPGQTFQRMQEELSAEISRASRSDAPGSERYRQALLGMRGALFDLMEQNTPPQIAQRWRDTNRQYAIFKTVEASMLDPSQQTLNTGFINPRVVAREQRMQMPDEWTRGDPGIDSFTNLVKAGAGIIPDPIPNSGTAQRMFAQDVITGGRQMFNNPAGPIVGMAQGASGVAAQAAASALDPITGLALPAATSRFWFRQPQKDTQIALPAAVESQKQRQKTRQQRMADALQRGQ